jgi:hypothetical protein
MTSEFSAPGPTRRDCALCRAICRILGGPLWVDALWLLRILVACRVSVLSVLGGFALFWLAEQAQDLFADISFGAFPGGLGSWILWASFYFAAFFVWAFPVHYAARRTLEEDGWIAPWILRDGTVIVTDVRKKYHLAINAIPRLLGVAPFVAVFGGLTRADAIVTKTLLFDASAAAHGQIAALEIVTVVVGAIFALFVWRRRKLLARVETFTGGRAGPDAMQRVADISLIAATAIFIVAFFVPFLPVVTAPRAVIAPYLFGSPVLFAAFLARYGARCGFPLLEFLLVLLLVGASFNDKLNKLRNVDAQPPATNTRQIDIDGAIEHWRSANQCATSVCPPALIVAIDGGASRAAFSAATALGHVFDTARSAAPEADPTRRLFAISGVSGGAFGAATIRTALVAAQNKHRETPPCVSTPRTWFAPKGASVTQSWRACLQALVVGDYLTPAFVGLGFRDNFAPGFGDFTTLTDDRAALIERAFEYHFDDTLEAEKSYLTEVLQSVTRLSSPNTGLGARFGYLEGDGPWAPLLILNGTSVNQGVRIVAADAISTRASLSTDPKFKNTRAALYPAALDLFEMLSTPCASGEVKGESCAAAHDGAADAPQIRDGADVRLSTAAMLSARFPVVSPPGIIRSKTEPQAGDRVVDGGYFENAGLTSAMDLARAVYARGVTPIVLHVQNDPAAGPGDPPQQGEVSVFPPRAAGTPRDHNAVPTGFDVVTLLKRFTAVVSAPFDTLTATRDGHALEATVAAQAELQKMAGSPDVQSFFTFRVYRRPDFKTAAQSGAFASTPSCAALKDRTLETSKVSMSWWLSQSVQAEIDSQICDARNRDGLADLIKRLSAPAATKAP